MKPRNHIARAQQSGAGKHKDKRKEMRKLEVTALAISDALMADEMRRILEAHERAHEEARLVVNAMRRN